MKNAWRADYPYSPLAVNEETSGVGAPAEPRYWNGWSKYIPLSEFGSVSLAVRKAAPGTWARNHPIEPDDPEPMPGSNAYRDWGQHGPDG